MHLARARIRIGMSALRLDGVFETLVGDADGCTSPAAAARVVKASRWDCRVARVGSDERCGVVPARGCWLTQVRLFRHTLEATLRGGQTVAFLNPFSESDSGLQDNDMGDFGY